MRTRCVAEIDIELLSKFSYEALNPIYGLAEIMWSCLVRRGLRAFFGRVDQWWFVSNMGPISSHRSRLFDFVGCRMRGSVRLWCEVARKQACDFKSQLRCSQSEAQSQFREPGQHQRARRIIGDM